MLSTQEYAALKNEIQQCIEFEFVSQTTMITTVIAIFAIAFQQNNPWLFLISYLPLLYFQTVTNKKRNGRLKIAAYIQVFHQEDDHWERMIYEVAKRTPTEGPNNPFHHHMGFISKMTAFVFSLLIAGCSIILFIRINLPSSTNLLEFIFLFLLHFFGVATVYSLNRKVLTSRKVSKQYISVFEELKSELNNSSNPSTASAEPSTPLLESSIAEDKNGQGS